MTSDATEPRPPTIIAGSFLADGQRGAGEENASVAMDPVIRHEVERIVAQHAGWRVAFSGPHLLAGFDDPRSALRCAVAVRQALAKRNLDLPEAARVRGCLGIHCGEVRIAGEKISGPTVDTAALLQRLAEPGGICISGGVRSLLVGGIDLHTIDLGAREIEGLEQPLVVHRVLHGDALLEPGPRQAPGRRTPPLVFALSAGLALLLVAGGAGFYLSRGGDGTEAIDVAARPPELPLREARPAIAIAVLPFVALDGDPSPSGFARMLSESLTTGLSRLPRLATAAGESAVDAEGETRDPDPAGRESAVRYALEGTVQTVKGRVRITAQLIDTATGFPVWSDRYDRDLGDRAAVGAEVSGRILAALPIDELDADAGEEPGL